MDLRHLGAVRKRFAVAGSPGLVGLDHLGIPEDHREQVSGVTDRDNLPIFVTLELGEREPTRHLHSVLVLRGNGRATQDDEYSRNYSQQPGWNFVMVPFLLGIEAPLCRNRERHASMSALGH